MTSNPGSDLGPGGKWKASVVEAGALSSQPATHSGQVGTAGVLSAAEDVLSIPRRRFHRLWDLLRRPKFVVGLVLVTVVALLAVLAPSVAHYDPNFGSDFTRLNQGPSSAHIFGTDYLGRDIWARLVWAGRTDLPAGITVVLLSFMIGVPWGIIAGFGGRLTDELMMRLIDVQLALPSLVLALSIVAILGSSIRSVVIALGIAGIPGYARVARASTLSTRDLDYVQAARATGAGALHIMRVHVFKNIIDPLVILATLNLSGAILAFVGLSFLGVGVQVPDADWGTMLANGYGHMFEPGGEAQVIFPALFIVVTVLGINLMGDALGETLNPRMQRR